MPSNGEQPLGAIVVGTGFGVLTHLRAMRVADIDVIALVGRDGEKAAARAKRFEVPHSTTVFDDALALPGVDAVAVVTPPHTHGRFVLAAAEAGKHIVCEKPFARDAGEATTMLQAADGAGVVHLLGTEFRFGTGQALLARTIRSGAIGEPRHALFELQLPTHADPAAELPDWWQLESEGGGWLGAHGSHVVDQIRSTLGEIVGVSATLQRISDRPQMTADDTYSVHLRLDNGAAVLMHSSCAARGQFVAATKVLGERGAAWLQGDEVWIDTGAGPEMVPTPDDIPLTVPDPPPTELLHTAYDMWHSMGIDLVPYARLYGVLRDRARGAEAGDPAAATFVDGVASQVVMDAIRASSRAGGAWTECKAPAL
jgi:predicted dehydrogenase